MLERTLCRAHGGAVHVWTAAHDPPLRRAPLHYAHRANARVSARFRRFFSFGDPSHAARRRTRALATWPFRPSSTNELWRRSRPERPQTSGAPQMAMAAVMFVGDATAAPHVPRPHRAANRTPTRSSH
jgi:hypothetical protein